MGDIKVDSGVQGIGEGQRVLDLPEMTIEGSGTNIMLVVPISALPEHVPSILMFLYESARAIEQDGRMLTLTLRIIDKNGHIIKETKRITVPRIKYEEFDEIADNYGFGSECRTSASRMCYDVYGVQKIVFDLLESARKAHEGDLPPAAETGASSPLEFPQEMMADLDSLPASEQSEARESYGLLTVLFDTGDLMDIEKMPPGGVLIVDVPPGKAKYPPYARGIALGALGTKLLNTLLAPSPCEEIQRLNRLLATLQDRNGGTKLLNDARRFIRDSLVFQMSSKSGTCSVKEANDGLDAMRGNCGKNDPCQGSIRDGLALYEGETLQMPSPGDMIGSVAAYYEIMLELSKKDRNAAIESMRVALEYQRGATPHAYHRYLSEMNVTIPEAFKAVVKAAEPRQQIGNEPTDFFKPVFQKFKGLEPEEKMAALALLREEMALFIREDNSEWKWRVVRRFIEGLFIAIDGDTPARNYLAESVIDNLCAMGKDRYATDKGPDQFTLITLFKILLGWESGEYLINNPDQTARLFRWVAGLTSVYAIRNANYNPSLMLFLWDRLRPEDRDALVAVAAKSVAEQMLCAYLNTEQFDAIDRAEKLGIGLSNNSFPHWEAMLGPEGMAAVAVAMANGERTRDASSITLLPIIEAVMNGKGDQEDRLYFVERLMRESNQPHIVAALILNCFRDLDTKTWRRTAEDRLQIIRSISNILDERASFMEDIPIAGPLVTDAEPKHVRHIFSALASGDADRLLRQSLRQKDGVIADSFFLTKMPMPVVPTIVEFGGRRPISLYYGNNPTELYRISRSFGLNGSSQYVNMWDFWQDIPPSGGFFADAVRASYRLAQDESIDLQEITFLLDFVSRPSNNTFYDDSLIGDFLEEKIVGSLKEVGRDERTTEWLVHAASLIKAMPFERRLRVLKAISAAYVVTARKASGGLPLGPISDAMGEAALGMNSLEELKIVLPIINLVSDKLNSDIPSDDPGFTGIITGMANVIGMLDEEKQIEIIGRVFDECLIALRGETLKLFDRLFEPKGGETEHADDFPRRVGMRLARSKATAYAHIFIGTYATSKTDLYEKRFDYTQEMALGAVEAFMDKDATITARDLQKIVFTVSDSIIYQDPSKPEFMTDRFPSWIADLGEVGDSDMLFVGIRPLIQLIQSEALLPSPRKNIIVKSLRAAVPNLGKIVGAILGSDKITPENRAAIARRFVEAASTCIAEGWKMSDEPQATLVEQCKLIKDLCEQYLIPR